MPINQTIPFDNSYAAQLEGFYVPWQGEKAPDPKIVQFNASLAHELGFDPADLNTKAGAAFFAGSELPKEATPLAQVYAGHQFGGFSQQLGDGRALLIGEVIDQSGQRRDIQLKGSGRTPFSRGGDGKAALGPVLREYLICEAMHALGVPSSRALAAVTTGEQVFREGLQAGAVLTRVASSHIRVGTFQYFAAREETDKLYQLADYSIARHYAHLEGGKDRYLGLLRSVANSQAALVAKWMEVGFIHGVMNTDNTTISGETIDYGPCAFMDYYNPKTVFSSIDQFGRYAYGNQPAAMQWNIARFAETLLPLIDPDDQENAVRLATNEINRFPDVYKGYWLKGMRAKLGLEGEGGAHRELVNALFSILETRQVDFTQLFRRLADAARGDQDGVRALFDSDTVIGDWLSEWLSQLQRQEQSLGQSAGAMDCVNPVYIPRNHMVEQALHAATVNSDTSLFDKLRGVLASPFERREGVLEYEEPAPASFAGFQTFCGT